MVQRFLLPISSWRLLTELSRAFLLQKYHSHLRDIILNWLPLNVSSFTFYIPNFLKTSLLILSMYPKSSRCLYNFRNIKRVIRSATGSAAITLHPFCTKVKADFDVPSYPMKLRYTPPQQPHCLPPHLNTHTHTHTHTHIFIWKAQGCLLPNHVINIFQWPFFPPTVLQLFPPTVQTL